MLLDGYSILEASIYWLIWFSTKDDDREFFASNEYIAEFFCVSIKTAKRAISHLYKDGLIDKDVYLEWNRNHRTMRVVDRDKYDPMLWI